MNSTICLRENDSRAGKNNTAVYDIKIIPSPRMRVQYDKYGGSPSEKKGREIQTQTMAFDEPIKDEETRKPLNFTMTNFQLQIEIEAPPDAR